VSRDLQDRARADARFIDSDRPPVIGWLTLGYGQPLIVM
jgi:hypothetical protein